MAKRVRDYKAEYARRNALAKERGFKGYSDYRRKSEKGIVPFIQPKRVRRVRVSQRAQDRRDLARAWSENFARSEVLAYRPELAEAAGLTVDQYTDAYLDAVMGQKEQRLAGPHRLKHNEALEHYLVDIVKWDKADEYETRYGIRNK